MMRRLHDERGIAAVTVLMVVVVLGLAGAAVIFTATSELGIGARERRAEDAFAAAEAGLDRGIAYLAQNPTFADLPAGTSYVCVNNPLVVDGVEIDDPNPAVTKPCGVQITSPTNPPGQVVHPPAGRPYIEYQIVSQAQEGRSVARRLASQVRLVVRELPFGMFVNGDIDMTGNAKLLCESMLVNGQVSRREKASTDCNGNGNQFDDPDLGWRFHKDRITSNPPPNTTCLLSGQPVGCSGVFANAQIFQKEGFREIHTDPAAAQYPNDRDVHQTQFDGSGQPIPVVTLPTTDVLEAVPELKRVAEAQNLYFDFRDGVNQTITIDPPYLGAPRGWAPSAKRQFEKNVAVYIDADAGDTIFWKVWLVPNDSSSDIGYINDSGVRVGSSSGVIVVRGGNLSMEANTQFSGAIFVPEGRFQVLGGSVCTCTIYANGFTAEGGSSTVQLTAAWFQRLPAGFVSVRRTAFAECEPFQVSALCPAP
jgi:hypothetical protein